MARLKHHIRNRVIALHRVVGLSAALFVVLVSISGMLINHEDGLGFTNATIESQWLLDWYRIKPRGELAAFPIGVTGRWAIGLERRVYVEGAVFETDEPPLVGATTFGRTILLASRGMLLLVTSGREAELIERLDSASLPGPLLRLGRLQVSDEDAPGFVVVETPDGVFRADAELLTWQRVENSTATWSRAGDPPEGVRAQALQDFRGRGLPLSRVIADLHSGRFFGAYGSLVMDAAAVALLVLSGTGIYVARSARRQGSSRGGLSI